MSDSTDLRQFENLAAHLAERRAAILQAWHDAVEGDPHIEVSSRLTRTQFHDNIPAVLDDFSRRLGTATETPAEAQVKAHNPAEHGIHRWQQGYNLSELIREWGHLHFCLVAELENYLESHSEITTGVARAARFTMASLINEGMSSSVTQYHELQQEEAAGELHDLEEAMAQMTQEERQRADIMRAASHDLHGSLQLVSTAAVVLAEPGLDDDTHATVLRHLHNGVDSLSHMLRALLDLARLQAGQEKRSTDDMDVALFFREFSAGAEHLARERGLYLRVEGPDSLLVQADRLHLRRIVQNLLLNALKYTREGGVTLAWEERDADQWSFCISDTGPGLPALPIADELAKVTAGDPSRQRAGDPSSGSNVHRAVGGEGIGLSIVKRLCELLDAGLEADSSPNGATFRVLLPRRYESGTKVSGA